MDNRANRYSPEIRARAVRMGLGNQGSYESQSAAIKAIAPKIGCGRDTSRRWVQQGETDLGRRDGVTSEESAMLRFRRMRNLQKFAAVHASVSNLFNQERNLSSRHLFKLNRTAALAEWRGLSAAQGTVTPSWWRRIRMCLTASPPQIIAFFFSIFGYLEYPMVGWRQGRMKATRSGATVPE